MKALAIIVLTFLSTGCAVIVMLPEKGSTTAIYSHPQVANATNVTYNYDVTPTAQLVDQVTGIVGAQMSGNSVGNNNASPVTKLK